MKVKKILIGISDDRLRDAAYKTLMQAPQFVVFTLPTAEAMKHIEQNPNINYDVVIVDPWDPALQNELQREAFMDTCSKAKIRVAHLVRDDKREDKESEDPLVTLVRSISQELAVA